MYSFGEGVLNEGNVVEVPNDMFSLPAFKIHAHGVVTVLGMVIEMMLGDDMESLANILQDLGARHVDYGVHPAHYGVVETALLRVLEGALGDVWTLEVRKGWAAVFKFVSKAMMSGAGSQLEITKERRKDLERQKSATIRLLVISRSHGTSKLSRGMSRAMGLRRFQSTPQKKSKADITLQRVKRNAGAPKMPTRRGDPPKVPVRHSVAAERRDSDATPAMFTTTSSIEVDRIEQLRCEGICATLR
jgi:hypothetical protein